MTVPTTPEGLFAPDVSAFAEDGDVVVFVAASDTVAVSITLTPTEAEELIDDLSTALVAAGAFRSAEVGAEDLAEARRLERTDPDNTDPRRLP